MNTEKSDGNGSANRSLLAYLSGVDVSTLFYAYDNALATFDTGQTIQYGTLAGLERASRTPRTPSPARPSQAKLNNAQAKPAP